MKKTRYWYHVSDSLTKERLRLTPRKEGVNRCEDEPKTPRICVAPSIEHCLTAIPYGTYTPLRVYRTTRKVTADKSMGIIDSVVTKEHWITKKVCWKKIGVFDLSKFKHPPQCASDCKDLKKVRRTLANWKKLKVQKRIGDVENTK